jgi:hypothetical protein
MTQIVESKDLEIDELKVKLDDNGDQGAGI